MTAFEPTGSAGIEPVSTASEQTSAQTEDAATAQKPAGKWILEAMRPGFLISMAEGQPVGIKQFAQFCLILIYPGWLFALMIMLPIYWAGYGVLWVLFWPVRAWVKHKNPEEYEATMRKYRK
ncbi:hypothetical protein [Mycobacterium sp. NPDC050853]|uniref:hypothetical protein n=1 Tax=Mycobacterium sp. NPDC050853 TaxID=3155160 RepID=UPI0033DF080D